MDVLNDSEILAEGKQVFTACAFIHTRIDGVPHVFMAKRAATKKFLPGVFELPGGHVDFGEDMVDGLKREIMEEFGMQINVGEPFGCFTYINEVKRSHSIEVVYFAEMVDDREQILLYPADHSEYRWVSLETITEIYTENKREDDQELQVVRRGLEILGGDMLRFH